MRTCDKMDGLVTNNMLGKLGRRRVEQRELSNVGDASGMMEKWRLLCRHGREGDDKLQLLKRRFPCAEQRGSGR